MIIEIKDFSEHDWAHMHDCILHVTHNTTKKKCTREELQEIFDSLPESLKFEAYEWGMADTLWRDKFINWLNQQKIWQL